MKTRILSLCVALTLVGSMNANAVEIRLEAAHLIPTSTVGHFENSARNDRPVGAVDQKMDNMDALKFSAVKPLNKSIY